MSLVRDREYRKGARFAHGFLCRMQADLKQQGHFEPKSLRWEYQIQIQDESDEYQAGFLDAIGAYVMTTLGDVLVDLSQWETLRVLERKNQKK